MDKRKGMINSDNEIIRWDGLVGAEFLEPFL